jgi:hypothetical protein
MRMMTLDGVPSEATEQVEIARRRGELERTDAQVTARHPCEHGARQRSLASDVLAGCHHGK